MNRKKIGVYTSIVLLMCLCGCNRKQNISEVYSKVEDMKQQYVVSDETPSALTEVVIDNSSIDYKKIDENDNYYMGEPPEIERAYPKVVNYKNPYDTKCLRENEMYAKIGESIKINGFEFAVLDVKYGDTFDLVYDMVDKQKGDEYISYLKQYHPYGINEDNTPVITSYQYEKIQGGYREKLLMIKCRLKNTMDDEINLRPQCSSFYYIADNKETKYAGYGRYCLGNLKKIYVKEVGMYTETPMDIVLAPGEEEEFIIVFPWEYTVNSKVDYGRCYALDKVLYIDTQFVVKNNSSSTSTGVQNCYMIPLVDHGIVVSTGEKIE